MIQQQEQQSSEDQLAAFAADVIAGLSGTPKRLSSKYFYDERGNELFRTIMGLDEYYLTRSEFEILSRNKSNLLALFQQTSATASFAEADGPMQVRHKDRLRNDTQPETDEDSYFELIEFGAGDGLKIKVLLNHFLQQWVNFKYIPIDISADAVNGLVKDLEETLPGVVVEGIQSEYFHALNYLSKRSGGRKVILFLGANIGNFDNEQARDFLTRLKNCLTNKDLVMIGFDLKKDPDIILEAYNDKVGVTKAFNLNLLARINRELGGNFNLDTFEHYPTYDPKSGEARSYLMSNKAQAVQLAKIGASFSFAAWEPIHVEISKKYAITDIEDLAKQAGFRVVEHLYDSKGYFVDTVWQPE